MKKKLLSLIALAAMMTGAQGAWADNVARIGSTEYETLAEAIGALSADGQTIEILADCTWPARNGSTTQINYNATIKPASGVTATITSASTNQTCQVYTANGKTLTIDGTDGTLTFDANGNAADFSCLSTGWAFTQVSSNLQVVKTSYAAYVNNTGYETFSAALEAATDGDVLYLNEDVLLSARLAIAKNITIKPMEGKDITIKRSGIAGGQCMLILNGASGGNLVLDGDGGSLTTDDNNATGSSTASIEIDTKGTVYMQNLTVKNSKMKCAVYFKNSGACQLKNVSFEDCETSDYGALYFVRNTITLGGNISFTNCTTDMYVNTNKGFIAEKVDDALTLAFPTAPVTVAFGTNVTTGSTLISNTSGYTDDIRLTNAGWLMEKSSSKVLVNYVSDSYDLTVTGAGMSTLVLPFDTDLPTGVSAYTLTADASTITATEVASITKDQPVLIVVEAGTYTFTGDAAADYSTEAPTEGALVGTYNAIDAAEGNYVLQKHTGYDAAFYQLTAESNKVIKPFRAYLTVPAASAREMKIVFAGGETTGISEIANSELSNTKMYDLQGRRVMQPAKGLYIVNGKKVLYQ